MKKVILAMGLLAFASVDLMAQGVVRPKQQRETLLERSETILQRNSEGLREQAIRLDNPFVAWVDPASLQRPRAIEAAPTVRAERLPDNVALDIIGSTFRPTGSMIGAGTAFLNLPRGNRVERGQSFTATVRDEVYEVTVEEVTTQDYTLRLGEATLRREFLQDRMGAGSITRPPTREGNGARP